MGKKVEELFHDMVEEFGIVAAAKTKAETKKSSSAAAKPKPKSEVIIFQRLFCE